jgi:lysyl-tRNA synthetase class II
LFKTKTGELTVRADKLRLLVKSLARRRQARLPIRRSAIASAMST